MRRTHMPSSAKTVVMLPAAKLRIALALCIALATSVLPTPTFAQVSSTAIHTLLEKAQFWYEHGNQPVALETFERVLTLEPTNTDALIGASKVALDMGREDLVKAYAVRLRKVSPNDPWLVALDTAKRRTPAESALLQEARHLTVLGRRTDALADYNKLMPGGKVDPELAGEYYPLLISTLPQDSVAADDALTALTALAQSRPKDLSLQLALAQGMIISEGSRGDGIDMLRKLAHNPLLSARVRPIWREALLWQGVDIRAQDQLTDYLKENPTDPDIEAKMADMRASLPSKALQARMLGYEAVTTGDYKTAETDFQSAIDHDKTDADAWIMMAVVRLKQGRLAEAQPYVKQAIALAPDRKTELLGMVGEDPVSNAKYAADSARQVAAQYKQVSSLADAGHYDQAQRMLRQLMNGKHDPGLLLQLADLQQRANQPDAALASLREANTADPSNADVTLALASALTAHGQTAEAQALFARAEQQFQRSGNEKALRDVRRAQADQMRRDALRLTDASARERALRAALDADPSSWWTRLEIARLMQSTGRGREAADMMGQAERTALAPGALSTSAGQEALQVAVVWAQQRGDETRAIALARRVPSNSRSPAMQQLLAQGALHDQVDAAMQSGNYAQRMMALASVSDPDGSRGEVIGRALLRQPDIATLRAVLAAELTATPNPSIAQRIRYAGLLMEGNQLGGARSVLAEVDVARLNADQRGMLNQLREKMAIAQADVLVRAKHPRDAQALLRPWVQHRPNDAALQVAMARVDTAMGHAPQALQTLLAAVDRNPSDMAARFGAIEAATAVGRLGLADELAQDGVQLHPQDAFMLLAAANVARARGMNGRALDDLERARALRTSADDTITDTQISE